MNIARELPGFNDAANVPLPAKIEVAPHVQFFRASVIVVHDDVVRL